MRDLILDDEEEGKVTENKKTGKSLMAKSTREMKEAQARDKTKNEQTIKVRKVNKCPTSLTRLPHTAKTATGPLVPRS